VAYLRLEGNLIVGNTSINQPSASRLISIEGNSGLAGNLDFFYNTVSTNNVLTHFFLDGSSSQQFVSINNSIIWDQGNIIETTGPINPALTVDCNYVHETTSFSVAQTATDIFSINPNFVNSLNGDFHVDLQSLSMDLCDENTIQSHHSDLNGKTRGYDNPAIGNLRGAYDAGAYEQNLDAIFSNGFE
jgi:hypothetical protein